MRYHLGYARLEGHEILDTGERITKQCQLEKILDGMQVAETARVSIPMWIHPSGKDSYWVPGLDMSKVLMTGKDADFLFFKTDPDTALYCVEKPF
jgi:hypothetical protein